MSAQELDLDDDSEELDEEQEPVEGDESSIRSCSRCGVAGQHDGLCSRCRVFRALNQSKKASEPAVTKTAPSIPVVKMSGTVFVPVVKMDGPRVCVSCGVKYVIGNQGREATKMLDHCPACRRSCRYTCAHQPEVSNTTSTPVVKVSSIPVVKVDAPAPAPEPAKPVDSPAMCARCRVKPVGRVVAGCKNNDCCPGCRRKARQSAAAKREQRAKQKSVAKAQARKTAPKPVTAPAATPNEMASRMVEAFAIVDAIGWETCRALRARIGGAR